MRVAFISDVGRVRENNEDYLVVDEEMGLVLVADGMGGHLGGEVASELAAATIQTIIRDRLERLEPGDDPDIPELIKAAIDRAHEAILQQAATDEALNGMGTTVVLGLCRGDQLHVAHVGDSRAYVINHSEIIPLTEDHSLVANLLKQGDISKKEAENHRFRHIITQCLGCDGYFGPELNTVTWQEDDVFLFCSDGLTDQVDDRLIKKIVSKNQHDLQNGVEALVNYANKKGGIDNVTVILSKYPIMA